VFRRNFLDGSRWMFSDVLGCVWDTEICLNFLVFVSSDFLKILSHLSHRIVLIFFFVASWQISSRILADVIRRISMKFSQVLEGVIFRIFKRFPLAKFFFSVKFLERVSVNIPGILMRSVTTYILGALPNAPLPIFYETSPSISANFVVILSGASRWILSENSRVYLLSTVSLNSDL